MQCLCEIQPQPERRRAVCHAVAPFDSAGASMRRRWLLELTDPICFSLFVRIA